ncbi:MAG: hypothetical protein AAF334_08830 [Pseudomonadota bacterium]
MPYSILMLGASYGSLLATKLVIAGHNVTMICLPEEAALFNAEGARVRIRPRGSDSFFEISSRDGSGTLRAAGPDEVEPSNFDLIGLAMQEPQYRAPAVADLLGRIAAARVPTMSIMNMPPLPFLGRVPGLDMAALREAYTDAKVWDDFEPGLMTLASPDPQATRPPGEPLNLLQVNLPTNFKVAPFEDAAHTAMLRDLERDVANLRFGPEQIELPVKLRVYDSLFVPMAKWAMLITGNYRCVTADGPQAIRDAVHGDVALAGNVYQSVADLCVKLGADAADMVPFEKYAKAAESLVNPSSAARALFGGAANIERVDRLVGLLARATGITIPTLDATVGIVDSKLRANREQAA